MALWYVLAAIQSLLRVVSFWYFFLDSGFSFVVCFPGRTF